MGTTIDDARSRIEESGWVYDEAGESTLRLTLVTERQSNPSGKRAFSARICDPGVVASNKLPLGDLVNALRWWLWLAVEGKSGSEGGLGCVVGWWHRRRERPRDVEAVHY